MVKLKNAIFGRNHDADESETEQASKPKREAPGRRPKYRPYRFGGNPSEKQKIKTERSRSLDPKMMSRLRKLSVPTTVDKDPLLEAEGARSPRNKSGTPTGKRAVTSPGNARPRSSYAPPDFHYQQSNSSEAPREYIPSLEPSTESSCRDDDRYMTMVQSDGAAGALSDDVAKTSSSLVANEMHPELFEEMLGPDLSEITTNSSYTENSEISGSLLTSFRGTNTDGETTLLTSMDVGTKQEEQEEDDETLTTAYTREIGPDLTLSQLKSESTEGDGIWSQASPYIVYKQKIAGMTIAISALQLALLLIQLILCGVASLEVNPMIGPFPDAFSEWGGKNAYLMLDDHQYFRLITPVLLHVGVLHLLVNIFCQLETCAIFEREWGSGKWILAYVVSAIGAVATSCVVNPNEIGVSSSGALMGLFGAKIAQLVTYNSFHLEKESHKAAVRMDHMGGVLCSTAVISLLSLVTYIDISGHAGGFLAGYFIGIILFCKAIASKCTRLCWALVGFLGLGAGFGGLAYMLYVETYPDSELADACQYFRNLYPEGYGCECQWG